MTATGADDQAAPAQADSRRMQGNVAMLTAARRMNPDLDVADHLFKQKASWLELMKTLRQVYGVDPFEAQKLALSHDGWKRWCEVQINVHVKCRNEALHHMRRQGNASLVTKDGGRLKVGWSDVNRYLL